MVNTKQFHCQYLVPLLDEVSRLIEEENWEVQVLHIFRETNRCADYLANLGHSGSFDCVNYSEAPSNLKMMPDDDARGVCLPMTVA